MAQTQSTSMNKAPGKPSGGGKTATFNNPPIAPKNFPEDYVECAEKVIKGYRDAIKRRQLTTSKLRNLLSQLVDVYNKENRRTEDILLPESKNALMLARIRILYEAGRDPGTLKSFIRDANLLYYLKDIGDSRVKMLNYYHYLEALVAYHKYYGGKEN